MGDGFVLWGRMRYAGGLPIKVMGGTERECEAELRRRADKRYVDGQ